MSAAKSVDVLLICALHAEYQAVIATTTGIDGQWETSLQNGFTVAEATFTTDKNQKINVVASYSPRMGESATIFATGLLQHYKPRCIAMTGICAGKRGDTILGDVIFAERAYRYDEGKQTQDTFLSDITTFQMDNTWLQRFPSICEKMLQDLQPRIQERPVYTLEAQAFWILERLGANENPSRHADRRTKCPDWEKALQTAQRKQWINDQYQMTEKGIKHLDLLSFKCPDGFPALPKFGVYLAPIATGSAVRSDGAAFLEQANKVRKVLGIEMEIAGIANVAHQANIPFVACKAVSDYGDADKDDTFHHFGMRISAECMLYFLRHVLDASPSAHTTTEQTATPALATNNNTVTNAVQPSISATGTLFDALKNRVSMNEVSGWYFSIIGESLTNDLPNASLSERLQYLLTITKQRNKLDDLLNRILADRPDLAHIRNVANTSKKN